MSCRSLYPRLAITAMDAWLSLHGHREEYRLDQCIAAHEDGGPKTAAVNKIGRGLFGRAPPAPTHRAQTGEAEAEDGKGAGLGDL